MTGLVRFDVAGFYGISTIVGYLMSNPLYTHTHTHTHTHIYIYIYIYIVIHRQICFVQSELISVARHTRFP